MTYENDFAPSGSIPGAIKGAIQVGGAEYVPGTLRKWLGHAAIYCSVPGTFSAPDVK